MSFTLLAVAVIVCVILVFVAIIVWRFYAQKSTTQDRILPEVAVESTGEGPRLTDSSDTWSTVLGLGVFVVIWNAFCWGIVFWGDPPRTMKLFVGGLFGGVGLLLVGVFIKQAMVVYSMEPGRLTLEKWPLQLGDELTVRFERIFKREDEETELTARFESRELATYQVGTDTRTAEETVYEESLPRKTPMSGATSVSQEWDVRVPRDGMQSLDVHRNRIEWNFVVNMKIDDFPDDDSNFEVLVLPEYPDD